MVASDWEGQKLNESMISTKESAKEALNRAEKTKVYPLEGMATHTTMRKANESD